MNVEYNYKNFRLIAFELKHDVRQIGFKLFIGDEKIFFATDTATLEHIEAKDFSYYLVEANYDEDEVEMEIAQAKLEGTFCYKNRVKETHLSVQQCEEWLLKNMGDDSKFIKMHQHVKKSN